MTIQHFQLAACVVLCLCTSLVLSERWSYGSANFNYTKLKFGYGDLTTYPQIKGRSGGVVYTDPVTVRNGFVTSFNWTTSGCTLPNLVRNLDYYDGINFIISSTNPSPLDYYREGYMYLPNAVVIGYNSDIYNQFYVCEWDTPPLYQTSIFDNPPDPPAPFFRRLCRTYDFNSLQLACGTSHQFLIEYAAGTISLKLDGASTPIFSHPLRSTFYQMPYYTGFSAYNSVLNSCYHEVSAWQWDSVDEVPVPSNTYLGLAVSGNYPPRIWLTRGAKGIGIASFNTYLLQRNQSLTINFQWNVVGSEDSETAFAVFFSPVSERDMVPSGSEGSGYGIQSRPNTTIIGYDRASNNFLFCSWSTPINTELRSFCPTIPNPLPRFRVNRITAFEVTHNQGVIEVYANNELLFSSYVALDLSLNLVTGFSGYSNTSTVHQYISGWSATSAFPTVNYTLNTTDYLTFGGASVYRDTITMVNNGTGVAVYKTPLPARLGFTTSFQWKPTNCTSDSGFTFLLTTTVPSDITVSSDSNSAGYGTSLLSRLTSFSLNYTSSQFTAYFDSTLGSAKVYTSSLNLSAIQCSDFISVKIEYSQSNLVRLYMANQLVASIDDRANTIINPAFYYLGLSGTEGSFALWNYTASTRGSTSHIKFRGTPVDDDMGTFKDAFNTMLGTATPGYTLTLTRGGSQSGAVYYSAPVYAHTGFSAYVYWKASSCDTVNNGADGFTLFLSKSIPQSSDVYMSSGGSLGIGAVPNVTMIAYSATFNEFYVCKWTTPLDTSFRWVCDFVFQSPIPKMTCSTSTGFNYSYDGVTFKLQYRSVTFNTTLKLDPVPYYVGLSGSTGGGYFTQEIKAWSFDSTAV